MLKQAAICNVIVACKHPGAWRTQQPYYQYGFLSWGTGDVGILVGSFEAVYDANVASTAEELLLVAATRAQLHADAAGTRRNFSHDGMESNEFGSWR